MRWAAILVSIAVFSTSVASACLRATPDRRAVQWSDTIVRAKLTGIDAQAGSYQVEVSEVIEGAVKPGEKLALPRPSDAAHPDRCPADLSTDDVGKLFLILLRSSASHAFSIVTIAAVDSGDPSSAESFRQLVDETRKSAAALTDDQIKALAAALADAQDDTEAQQAEDTLLQMGPKASDGIRAVMAKTSEAGKKRLQKVLDEILPPVEATASTKPAMGDSVGN